MPRKTYAAQQAHIEKAITKLRKQAQVLLNKRRKPVINSLIRSMREYEITPEELAAAYGKPTSRQSTASSKKASSGAERVKRPVAPKYRDPESGKTWSGRGKPPVWLSTAVSAGARKDDFLI